jgi:hypothetical protein
MKRGKWFREPLGDILKTYIPKKQENLKQMNTFLKANDLQN